MITTTELLEFLCKAQKLCIHDVTFEKMNIGYKINLYYDWHGDNDRYIQSVLISNEGESSWNDVDYEFHTMNKVLDNMIEREEQKKIKAQKRQELIESLTPEQRELLGVCHLNNWHTGHSRHRLSAL